MKRPTLLVATVVSAALPCLMVPTSAGAATHETRSGHTIVLDTALLKATSIAPLDGFPLSAEALLSSDVHASIAGIAPGENVRATVEVGYQVGYPVSVAPDGVKVTAHTPELKLTGGVNAKLAPSVTISPSGGGGSLGEIGGQLGAEARWIF